MGEPVEVLAYQAGEFVEEVLERMSQDIPQENELEDLYDWAEMLETATWEEIDFDALGGFLYSFARTIQEREDRLRKVVHDLLSDPSGPLRDVVVDVLYESDLVTDLVECRIESDYLHRAEMQESDESDDPVFGSGYLDEGGFCECCGLHYESSRMRSAEIVNTMCEVHNVQKANRELELLVAELEIVGRGVLDDRAKRIDGRRRR